MADLSGVHFEYAGISSRLYGLITGNVETTRFTQIAGEIGGVTIYNKKNRRQYLIDDEQDDSPVSLEIDIVTEDGRCLEANERRQIEKWLFNRGKYKKFYLDVEDDIYGETTELVDGIQKRLYLNCRFINPERLEYNGGIVGYKVTMDTDSCMWWQDPVTKTFAVNTATTSSTANFTVQVDTDLDDYVYPKITITTGGTGGNVSLWNATDNADRRFTFDGLQAGTIVTVDSEINYVSDGHYSKLSDRNFPRLIDGGNSMNIMGCVASVVVEYQNRRNF